MRAAKEERDRDAGAAYVAALGLRMDPFDPAAPIPAYRDPAILQRLNLLRHLIQATDQLIVVHAPAGGGKSTALAQLREHADAAWRVVVLNGAEVADVAPAALYARLAAGFAAAGAGPADAEAVRTTVARLRGDALLPVILVDDAHRLAPAVLDALLGLAYPTGPDTPRLVLFAEPDLLRTLEHADPPAGASGSLHAEALPPFDREQTEAFLMHRLLAAGLTGDAPLTPRLVKRIHRAAGGIPAAVLAAARARFGAAAAPPPRRRPAALRLFPALGFLVLAGAAAVALIGIQAPLGRWLAGGAAGPGTEGPPAPVVRRGAPPPGAARLSPGVPAPPRAASGAGASHAAAGAPTAAALEGIVAPPPAPRPVAPAAGEGAPAAPAVPTVSAASPAPAPAGAPSPPAAPPPPVSPATAGPPAAPVPPATAGAASAAQEPPAAKPHAARSTTASATSKVTRAATPAVPKTAPGTAPEAAPKLTPKSVPKTTRKAAPETAPSTATGAGSALRGPDWLLARDPRHYTLQIAALRRREALAPLLRGPRGPEPAAWFPVRVSGRTLYALVYGDYRSRAAAERAAHHLPGALRGARPWIRSLASVQAAIRAGRGHAPARRAPHNPRKTHGKQDQTPSRVR